MFQSTIYRKVVLGLSGTSAPATALSLTPGDGAVCGLGRQYRCERAQCA